MKNWSILVVMLGSVATCYGQATAVPSVRIVPASAGTAVKVVPAEGGVVTPAEAAKATGATPAAGGATPAAPSKTPEQERMEKLLKLKFDRRASVYLKAWAGGGEAKTEEENEEGEKKEPTQSQKIDAELKAFQEAVTLGKWDEVKRFFAEQFPKEDDAKKAYKHVVDGLNGSGAGAARPTPVPGRPMPAGGVAEVQVLLPDDVVGLADAAPVALAKEWSASLGGLLGKALSGGEFVEGFLETVRKGTARLGGDDPEKRMAVARLLIAAGRAAVAGEFLPDAEEAAGNGDAESLELLAQYYLALKDREEAEANLERAWEVNQKLLAVDGLEETLKVGALTRAVDLAPRVEEALGKGWLEASFKANPERGMEVLATIGGLAAQSRMQMSASVREKKLELQSTAVESLLETAPERGKEWARTLNVLAVNWLTEAQYSYQRDQTQSSRPQMQFDQYGNMYYADPRQQMMRMQTNNRMPQPVATGTLLEMRPSDAWAALLDPSLAPQLALVTARLYLKVNEEEEAFPFIEQMATTHPDEAEELANEFVRVWARNHDPNEDKRRTGRYMYFYGYSQRADSIPLTRSKQQRNLEELANWVKRLSALPIGKLDESVLADAFVRTHSQAEVYRLEDIEQVFGETEKLEAATLARLLTTMRANLASLWRDPRVQQASKTKRKDAEIQAEVARGYVVADDVLGRALERYPESWELQLVKAAMAFDQNNYRKEQAEDSEFSSRKRAAFAEFEKAAAMYTAGLASGETGEDEETDEVFTTWFYATLGASDLGALKAELLSDPGQQEKLREVLLALPGESSERHLMRFANLLSARATSVKAEMKHRYLRAGLAVCGNHKQAAEAKKLFDYYEDLVTEIQLVARVDGSDAVGSGEAFGVFVDLEHTKMIEREAGGFGKYLTNQNNNPYAYNYGRPTENYRDKFEETAREALADGFEVLSVTFHDEKTGSRGMARQGWRMTPYAYLLLKARGEEVDVLPPMRMDLDFLDTSGYVVLPVESAKVPLDARGDGEARPFEELRVTQTLDEREAADGKLLLEVKATARGLVPGLDRVLDVAPGEFDVVSVDDQGVAVVQMDAESEENRVVSERNWVVTLQAKEGLEAMPTAFRFASPRDGVEVEELLYQRYDDADMALAEAEISLEQEYGEASNPWVVPGVAGGVFLLGLAAWLISRPKLRGDGDAAPRYTVPTDVTPFTVVALLRRIGEESNGNLGDAGRAELTEAIGKIESSYFAEARGGGSPAESDLRRVAEDWVKRVA